jgi:hypothetical protein
MIERRDACCRDAHQDFPVCNRWFGKPTSFNAS